MANSDVTEESLNCTDSLLQLTALLTPLVPSIRCIVLWSENQFCPNLDPAPDLAGFEFLNLARSGSSQIWKSQIQYNPNVSWWIFFRNCFSWLILQCCHFVQLPFSIITVVIFFVILFKFSFYLYFLFIFLIIFILHWTLATTHVKTHHYYY